MPDDQPFAAGCYQPRGHVALLLFVRWAGAGDWGLAGERGRERMRWRRAKKMEKRDVCRDPRIEI